MPSRARSSLDRNADDIRNLIGLHGLVGGVGRGRRHGLEVLNKSAIILITAFWEAYCEDIAAEGLAHIVKHGRSANALPTELKRQLAKELKAAPHELEVWKIADRGWKKYLEGRLGELQTRRNRNLNTPRSDQIDELFLLALGINQISNSWHWRGMSASNAAKKLNQFVTLRGEIAHRGRGLKPVKLAQVKEYYRLVSRLAAKTGGQVQKHMRAITNKPLWT